MNLSIGIVGLPNVGKSTLFQILTKKQVEIANYPFTTINPNIGITAVPDERLLKIAEKAKVPKTIPATVKFVDIAGLVKGASKGEGLGNQFLSHIREVDAITLVARCFKDANIIHTEGNIDPIRDIEIIALELIFKDMETVHRRLDNIQSALKTGSKEAKKESEMLDQIKIVLSAGQFASEYAKHHLIKNKEEEQKIFNSLQLLTAKPIIYLLNGAEEEIPAEFKEKFLNPKKTSHLFSVAPENILIADLEFEKELEELSEEDKLMLGNPPSQIDILIKKSYGILNLITFFTMNENEARAWPIKKGTKITEAAGQIHTDFEKKFIKAEVINWQKFIEAGFWNNAKEKGLLRLEGKEYIVEDGDIILIKHG